MFRMLRLKPPNGWQAVAWELAIVTAGILIALAVQQWAEERSWRSRAQGAMAALRDEVALHYYYSLEWRAVEPCIIAQINGLQQRLLDSGQRLDPAPVHSEPGFAFFVVRLPLREYDSNAWQTTVAEGVASHLPAQVRRELSGHYAGFIR